MPVGSEPIIVRGGRIEPVHLSAERRIILKASEAVGDPGIEAPDYVAYLARSRIDDVENDGELTVSGE